MITAHRYFNAPVESISVSEEEAFFSTIQLANSTFKTTALNRMDELDMLTAHLVRERAWRRPLILDAGVSSGITTLNLDCCHRHGSECFDYRSHARRGGSG
jgi:hypothetical protein